MTEFSFFGSTTP